MKNKDYQLAVVLFDGRDTAEEALAEVKRLKDEKKIVLEDVVAVNKDDNGKVKLKQGRSLTGKKGALGFGTAGLIAGAIIGGPIVGAALGAALGGAGSQIKKVFGNKEMKEMGAALDEDSSILFLMLSDSEEDAFNEAMKKLGGKMYGFFIAEEGLVAMGGITEDEAFLSVMQEEVQVVGIDASVKLDKPESKS
jgi:uncharacterized membrane protein